MHAAITRTCVGSFSVALKYTGESQEVHTKRRWPSAIHRRTYSEHGEHQLAHVEGVSPVVVENHSVILPHCQKPPAQGLKWEGEAV